MTNVLIVEDSAKDVRLYEQAIAQTDDLKLHFATSAEEALRMLEKQTMDLFFLDVELPGINGFSLAKKLRETAQYELAPIMFITGYSKNQLQVFKELHCYDYIVKPFSLAEFRDKLHALIQMVGKTQKNSQKKKMVLLQTTTGDYLLEPDQIRYAETQRNSCILHLEDEVLRLPGVSLTEIVSLVDEPYFIRCHRSFAVNLKQVKSVKNINYRLSKIELKQSTDLIDASGKYFAEIEEKCHLLAMGKDGTL